MKIVLSPQEFRALLSPELQKTFDDIVAKTIESGIDKELAESMLAKSFMEYLRGKK